MHALKELGYAYGIIGAAGPTEFYERVVNAHLIPDSEPGIYRDMLKVVSDQEREAGVSVSGQRSVKNSQDEESAM
jgi:hypothetical protein